VEDVVVVDNLHKTYGKNVIAVAGISFKVKKGEIFGFLANGAGKSTTIKILTTLLEKTSGKARRPNKSKTNNRLLPTRSRLR